MRCSVFQLSTRRCVPEEKASDQTQSLSSWKVRQQHAIMYTLKQITPPPPTILLSVSSLWQISMNVRSCQACAREDSASTPLAASSVNVQEALPSTQTPESVKVLDTHLYFCAVQYRHMNTQVTYSSLVLASGHFSGKEIESSWRGLRSARTHGERGKGTESKKTKKYWTLLSP